MISFIGIKGGMMYNLTEREMEVLKYLTKGFDNEEIAKFLFISKHTVKAHMSAIIRKLKAKNRVNALYIATINHLI